MLRRLSRLTIAGPLVLALAVTLAGCGQPSAGGPGAAVTASPTPSVAALTGVKGAVSFDEGYVTIGTGPKIVDLYLDPMCPYCKLFEQTSGPMLLDEAQGGRATLRVHPLAILNRFSQGTDYSTRAAAVFAAASALSPAKASAYLSAMYAAQPKENTPGLTDAQLIDLGTKAGVDASLAHVDLAPYRAWVDTQTTRATTGPLTTTREVPAVRQVPTVVVDGAVFTGNSDQKDAFLLFYMAK